MDQDTTYSYIESKIRNNDFKNKEELNKYMIDLKNSNFISQEQILKLLSLYDELYHVESVLLNIENYKGVGLENQNLIVSTQSDRILKTESSPEDITKEFKETQNEIIAKSDDALANADTVFNYMANNQKEEMRIIPLSEMHTVENIDVEILKKIQFFISNQYVNPYVFRVNLDTGIFYNMETSEVLEVRKNEVTEQYQIYKGSEMVYGDTYQNDEINDNPEPITDIDEEEQAYENRNAKVRRLVPPKNPSYNNRAFSKMGFLLLIIALSIVTLTVITLIKK